MLVQSQRFWNKKVSFVFRKYIKMSQANNMKKTELNGHVYDFSVDYTVTDTCHIIYIHKYLMKKYDKKKMFV